MKLDKGEKTFIVLVLKEAQSKANTQIFKDKCQKIVDKLERGGKMKEEFIDSENKIITECPDCANQSCLYLISSNRLKDGYLTQHCDNCHKPYVVFLETTLTAQTRVYRCEEVLDKLKKEIK